MVYQVDLIDLHDHLVTKWLIPDCRYSVYSIQKIIILGSVHLAILLSGRIALKVYLCGQHKILSLATQRVL